MEVKVRTYTLQLKDSYLVSKKNFDQELDNLAPEHAALLALRSRKSLKWEWAVHNLAYQLGIRRSKTKDVDLNYDLKWYEKVFYALVGRLALLLIK